MKKWLVAVAVLASCALGRGVMAQEMKLGLVDFQKALNDVEEGKSAKARLKGEFDQKQKTLDALQNDLKTMKDNLEKQKTVLSKEALQQKEGEYRDKFVELQKKLAEFRGELQQKEMEYTGNIITAMRQVVQEVGAQEKFTLILEKGQDSVLYAPTATDLTAKVIAAYNSKPRAAKPAAK
ncbi:MAG: OmpH family outer membrane protein [Deltaproteobacteria bacterium]|nr:OmpH family outer membrane protein [Deltaproteobacteria bacterium]